MEFSEIFKYQFFSCVVEQRVNESLKSHLLREDGQEDLTFALWIPSYGKERVTAIIKEVLLPMDGERIVHGNVSFSYQYVLRACKEAQKKGYGVALLHSHPIANGWQDMSTDDYETEHRIAVNVFTLTDMPLVGLTLANDGFWAGRIWSYNTTGSMDYKEAASVRVVGAYLETYFNDSVVSPVKPNRKTMRTVNLWGAQANKDITRLNIGIVGLGSVGSVVAEMLARMGITTFTLVDYDKVEEHNLDRLAGIYAENEGEKKIDAVEKSIRRSSTADILKIIKSGKHVAHEKAYRKVLDCDLIFCCADKPWGRYILNHIAYAHLIPVIDGGIGINFNDDRSLDYADWTVHTISPGLPCLHCLNAYFASDVELEKSGKLEDPEYINGLDESHRLKKRQNISPFTYNLASMEVIRFMVLTSKLVDAEYYPEQRFRFKHGSLKSYSEKKCEPNCDFSSNIGVADTIFQLYV